MDIPFHFLIAVFEVKNCHHEPCKRRVIGLCALP